MAKKTKKKKKNKKRTNRKSTSRATLPGEVAQFRRGRQQPSQQRVAEQIWELPVFAGSRDRKAAWAYLERFMVFESWIMNDRKGDVDVSAIPPEYEYLLRRWPEAFEMFRHAMWSYAERVMEMNPWTSTLRSLLARARAVDPAGFAGLETAISTALPHFEVQRNNVLQQIQEEPSMLARERHRTIVKMYADMYEIDFPLWLIGVLGRAYRTGSVDTTAFGGPLASVAQGSLIHSVRTAVAGTPLAPLLDDAYVPALRNSIGHNGYAVVFGDSEGDDFAGIRDTASNQMWPAEKVIGAWRNTADLINAAMSACASTKYVVIPSEQKQFADCGVIAINYAVVRDVPIAMVAQLWCFRDVDPDGMWLDEAQFIIEVDGRESERAGFTPRAYMAGTPLSDKLVGRAVRDRGWIRVIRVPVAPNLDMGFPVFEHMTSGKYEIVGVPDEHDVPFRNFSPLPRKRNFLDTSEREAADDPAS